MPDTVFVKSYLGYLLGQANHALYKDFDSQVRAAGLSSIEWRVLACLHDQPPMPVSVLAREVLAQQPTVTKLVQRMGEQGWVRLQSDPDDQRRTLVAATAKGLRVVKPLLAQAAEHEARVLQFLKPDETTHLKELLSRLAEVR